MMDLERWRCPLLGFLYPFSISDPVGRPKPERSRARVRSSVRGRCPYSRPWIPSRMNSVVSSEEVVKDSEVDVEFPKPLSPLQRAQRAAQFWAQVGPILFRYQLLARTMEARRQSGTLDPFQEEREWNELHEWGSDVLARTIQTMKGFYVKTGQVISTRVDLFPEQYTTKLQALQDSVEPISTSLIKRIVSNELLEGEPLETLFESFDDEPLGSASIAQVHKAVLLDGRTVAVKVQRPAEEPKLRGDVGNLKAFAARFRGALPVDYYPVFCELERALTNELDFLCEAQSIEKIAAAVAHRPDGSPAKPPLYVPRPIPGLVTKRVLIMEFVEGIALNRIKERMEERGFQEGGPEVILFGKKLLESLSEAFSRMIFGPGFIHGDPHPGNIFVMPNGTVSLIDCGQVKQLASSRRLQLAELITRVAAWETEDGPSVDELARMVKNFGVEVEEGAGNSCLASIALLLFGPPGLTLPGGWSNRELSAESPLRKLTLFPQELVMLGRATILIKGISSRVGIPWNLSEKWAESAEQSLVCGEDGCMVPVYAAPPAPIGGAKIDIRQGRPKFRDVRKAFQELRVLFREWLGTKIFEIMPKRIRTWIMNRAVKRMKMDATREEKSIRREK